MNRFRCVRNGPIDVGAPGEIRTPDPRLRGLRGVQTLVVDSRRHSASLRLGNNSTEHRFTHCSSDRGALVFPGHSPTQYRLTIADWPGRALDEANPLHAVEHIPRHAYDGPVSSRARSSGLKEARYRRVVLHASRAAHAVCDTGVRDQTLEVLTRSSALRPRGDGLRGLCLPASCCLPASWRACAAPSPVGAWPGPAP
jgi:hypothetical protein